MHADSRFVWANRYIKYHAAPARYDRGANTQAFLFLRRKYKNNNCFAAMSGASIFIGQSADYVSSVVSASTCFDRQCASSRVPRDSADDLTTADSIIHHLAPLIAEVAILRLDIPEVLSTETTILGLGLLTLLLAEAITRRLGILGLLFFKPVVLGLGVPTLSLPKATVRSPTT